MTSRCGECGEKFSDRELLEEHYEVEHPGSEVRTESGGLDPRRLVPDRNFYTGVLLGAVIVLFALGGLQAYQDFRNNPVKVTVVTCDNCSYERFKVATDRMFDIEYSEVNYDSTRGQELIGKYEINYVPGFVFEKEISDRENFTRVRNALVEFDDSYVMSDQRNEAAQRFSKGFSLN